MDYLGKKCPVCSCRFHDDDDIVVCPECGAPYHRQCYMSKGSCIFPELHEQGKTWHDPKSAQTDDEEIVCPNCGCHNSQDNVMCIRCGRMLYLNETDDNRTHTQNTANTSQNETQQIPFGNMEGMPFVINYDPMGGVSPDEDFDGVSGAEIAKNVKVNTHYYMNTFKVAKETGVSKFNFAAFLFSGGWMLYRKQYLKGGIITALVALCMIAQDFFAYFYSSAIWSNISKIIEASGNRYANITTYLSELFKLPFGDIVLALLPYVCSIILFIISVVVGLTANKSYYKYVVQKIKKLKSEKNGEALAKALDETGGVNRAIAYTLLICDLIISVLPFILL